MMNFGRRLVCALTLIGMFVWVTPWMNPVSWGQETPSAASKESTSADQGSIETPAATEEKPAATEETPAATEETPAATEEKPAATEENPAIVKEALPPKSGTVTVPETSTGPKKYTVKQGDTLWGISNAYLQDSFLWPKLWNNNQYIMNPDLIYPGNVLDLPGGEAAHAAHLEARVETARPANVPPPKVVEEAAPPPESEKRVEITPPEAPVPAARPLATDLLAASGYILTGQTASAIVVGARDNRELIGQDETAYLLPKEGSQPHVGDRFTVYRVVRKVYHPKTGKYLGDLIRILGQAEIIGADPKEKTVTSKVITSYDSIQTGDSLMPAPVQEESADQTGSIPSGPHDGFIVDVKENRVSQAQADVVYIDQGRSQGVHAGDRFEIVRDGDKTSYFSPGNGVRLPRRTVGELQVISVQDATATAQVVQSTEVIYKGDHFETPPSP